MDITSNDDFGINSNFEVIFIILHGIFLYGIVLNYFSPLNCTFFVLCWQKHILQKSARKTMMMTFNIQFILAVTENRLNQIVKFYRELLDTEKTGLKSVN